jgi:hypothetical protein
MKRTVLTLVLVCLLGWVHPVQATPITYTETVTGTGTFGTSTFANALVTLTLAGDTSLVVGSAPHFDQVGSATVGVAGVGLATFINPVFVVDDWGVGAIWFGTDPSLFPDRIVAVANPVVCRCLLRPHDRVRADYRRATLQPIRAVSDHRWPLRADFTEWSGTLHRDHDRTRTRHVAAARQGPRRRGPAAVQASRIAFHSCAFRERSRPQVAERGNSITYEAAGRPIV